MKPRYLSPRRFHSVLLAALALSLSSAAALAQAPPPFQIRLAARKFIPPEGFDAGFRTALDAQPPGGGLHGYIQFRDPLTLSDHALLETAGVRLVDFLHHDVYVAWVPRDIDWAGAGLGQKVRWTGPIETNDKIGLAVRIGPLPPWAFDGSTGEVRVVVNIFRDSDVAAVLRTLGIRQIKVMGRLSVRSVAILATLVELRNLAAMDSIQSIEMGPVPKFPLNENGRRTTNTDAVQRPVRATAAGSFGLAGWTGNGVRIGVFDSKGFDESHADFSGAYPGGTGSSRVYEPGSGPTYDHATQVASVAAGNGSLSDLSGFPEWSLRGHAPRASLGNFVNDADEGLHDAITEQDTHVTVHPYNQGIEPKYYGTADDFDLRVRGDATWDGDKIEPRCEIWSLGNNGVTADVGPTEGYYSGVAAAKNVIAVGSVDALDGQVSDLSSLGPTYDGRVKPDLVAPGAYDSLENIGLWAAIPGPGYGQASGTSFAAPAVAGILALMMEAGASVGDPAGSLLPSTYKAMLIETARDCVKARATPPRDVTNPDTGSTLLYHAGPDFASGFGLVDAEAAVEIATHPARYVESTLEPEATGHEWIVTVPEGSLEVKVVLAWDDEPGSTVASATESKLINDLDLVLVAPDGMEYHPWTLEPLPLSLDSVTLEPDADLDPISSSDVKPAERGVDDRNNVEMVSVCRPVPGIWKIRVDYSFSAFGNYQPYSVAVSHDMWMMFYVEPGGPFTICDRFPFLCRPPVGPPVEPPEGLHAGPPLTIDPRSGVVHIDPLRAIPLSEICKLIGGCRPGRGSALLEGPGLAIELRGHPEDAKMLVLDDLGTILVENEERTTERIVTLESVDPGRRLFLLLVRPDDRPYEDTLSLELALHWID